MSVKIKYRFKSKKTLLLIKLIDFFGGFLRLFMQSKPFKSDPEKILIIRLDHIGDAVLTLPAIHALRARFPKSYIAVLSNSVSSGVFKADPNINEIIVYDAPWFLRKNKSSDEQTMFKIIKSIKEKKFDIAIDFRGDIRNIFLMFASGIPVRIGYGIGGGGFMLTDIFEHKRGIHEVEKNNNLIRSYFSDIKTLPLKIYVSSEDDEHVRGLLLKNAISQNDLVIGIHPGAGCSSKLWSCENFAKVGMELVRKYKARVILTGSKGEKPLLENINRLMGNSAIIAEHLSVPGLMALVKHYKLLITADSAPLHIASALNIPTIAVFSATNDLKEWRPFAEKSIALQKDVACKGCELENCDKETHLCMEEITAEEVLKAASSILN